MRFPQSCVGRRSSHHGEELSTPMIGTMGKVWGVAMALLIMASALSAQTIAVSGDPAVLTVRSATAGLEPDPASEATTTYAVTTTSPNQRIMARIDAPLPEGMTLTIRLAAPPGATSRGPVTMQTADQELVQIPTPGSYAGLAVSYTLTAVVRAGPVPSLGRGVTLTVTSEP
jgi:hypothetical protein